MTLHASYAQPFGNTTAVPPNRNFYIGGPDSVRGFRESTLGPRDSLGNAYGGDMALTGQLEAILPVPQKFQQSARLRRVRGFRQFVLPRRHEVLRQEGVPDRYVVRPQPSCAPRRVSRFSGSRRWACSDSVMEFPCATRKRRSLIMAMSSKASSSPSVVRSELAHVRGLKIRRGSSLRASLLAVGLASCKKVLNQDDDDSMHTRMVNLLEDSPTVQYKIEDDGGGVCVAISRCRC